MSKRELIDTENEKRYVRRGEDGKFMESAHGGNSLAADQRQHSSKEPARGEGDKADRLR